jgi:multidrug efflux pump subunit AcrB
LLLTGYPFGFTAFLGLISLSGLVVRNAIILLDFIHERMHQGVPLEEASLEAGKRRLRPIFLTSVAGAVGVVPMILSGSSLWGPLGSLIASGILVSMVLTLIVIPVLYVVVNEKREKAEAAAAHAVPVAVPVGV